MILACPFLKLAIVQSWFCSGNGRSKSLVKRINAVQMIQPTKLLYAWRHNHTVYAGANEDILDENETTAYCDNGIWEMGN